MTRHVGAAVSAYVDRRLAPTTLAALDRHVVVCITCRAAVDAERRVRDSLRDSHVPGLPGSLQQMLLGMGTPPPPPTAPHPPAAPPGQLPLGMSTGSVYPFADPTPTPTTRRELRVLAPTAPAQHFSPFRAIAVGGFAAGAAAAAAWGFVGTGPVAVSPTSVAPTGVATVRVDAAASLSGRGSNGVGSWASVRSVQPCPSLPTSPRVPVAPATTGLVATPASVVGERAVCP